ncbi:lysine--tRNA ligase [Olsenella sp. Marseille-P4559]|uniref:lysine--tRNA ligase n=1 Tax=Olsenella sp. Marseille-P4559 TaxID=2364795 RepID=UPI001030FC0C|nr:lysine--tRNA ligase [Olsenella sp. Marseille-P4559]
MADQSKTGENNTNDERAQRRARRQALIDAGVDPYPIRSNVTAHAAELEQRYANLQDGEDTTDEVTVAGRVRAFRDSGKIAFVVLEDATGQIQLFCRVNNFAPADWGLLKQVDLGDIVEATGVVVRTRRGQLSVSPTSVRPLSKSLRPLPEKFHGLTDREVRYRQRYVDLIMNPEVRDVFRRRSAIVSLIRRYMEADGYMEVETPMMHAIMGGANAKPFVTHFNALDRDFYLRIATELPLKRLIVGGMERVFEIGRQFRNEGMDLTHNPEFTTMEAYCAYSDLDGMKRLTEGLFKAIAREVCGCEEGHEAITYQGQEVDMSGTWRSVALSEVASQVVGEHVDMDTPIEHLRGLCAAHGIDVEEGWGAGKLLFELYDELGESTLVNPTFVCDYPEEVSPLAKRKEEDPRLTDRFELVICGHEYANAFSELNDPVDQAGRFAEQVAAKGMGDDEAMGYDYDYVRALEYGMPPAGGIGYGIDRMVMLFCDQPAIRDVLLFPQMKPEVVTKADIASQLPEATDSAASVDAIADDAETGASQEVARESAEPALSTGLTRDQALSLLRRHNKDPFHIQHAETLEGLMRHYAERYDPANVDFWGQVGLLHDLDWEESQDPVRHTVRAGELIEAEGGTPELVHAIQTHNSDNNPYLPQPEARMERVLYAADELSGLIQAAVLMRPSKSVMDLEVKSLKKKFKDKRFAAGCSRDVIRRGAELNGMELDDLFASMICAMRAIAPDRDEWLAAHLEDSEKQ